MQTRCPACLKWTSLPETQRVNGAFHVQCEHCREELPAMMKNRRYLLCRICSHYYLRDLELCPICPPPGNAVAVPWLRLMLDQPADGAIARLLPRPLAESYCVSLWEDYQREQAGARDRVQAGSSNGRPAPRSGPSPAPTAPPTILPPEPMAMFDLGEITPTNGNGHANGNGHGGEPITIKAHEGLDGVDYELISDQTRLAEVAELLASAPILSVDTETDGLDPYGSRLLLLQIAVPGKCYIVDCQRRDLNVLPLKPILEGNRTLKLLQNAKFDYKMLKHIAGIELCNIFDTMLAERLLTAGRAREIGLKALASKYAGVTMDKTIRKSFVGVRGDGYLSPEQLAYAARDALILFEIHTLQTAELKKWRLEKVAKLENECVAAVGDMELNGLVIDTTRWRAILEKVAVERDNAAVALNDLLATVALQSTMFGVPVINLNSNSQLMNAFARLGVMLEDTREQTLAKQGDNPAIKKLLDYRGHEKTLSAFGEELLKLINPHTGRMHPDFNQYGADTGRFSCLAGETLVSTPGGLRRIDSIRAGDTVQTSFGSRKVTAAWCNGVRPLLKITLSDGRILRLTSDHTVLTGQGDTWRAMQDVKIGDNMFLSLQAFGVDEQGESLAIGIDPGAYYVKRNTVIPQELSVPLCELAGLITADGTFGRNARYRGAKHTTAQYDRVHIDCGWDDGDLIAQVADRATLLFGVPFTEMPHKTARRLTLASTRVAGALANLGLTGKATTKRVPQAILQAPAPFQAAYLRGLFEGDGHITSDGRALQLKSVNHSLLQTAQIMLSYLGCYSTIQKASDCTGFSGNPRYVLALNGGENIAHFMAVVGFMSARKNSRIAGPYQKPTGTVTPIRVSGSVLYRQAVDAGLLSPSRASVKPFVPLYKQLPNSTAKLDSLLIQWGDLPELSAAKAYRMRKLHCVRVVSIEPDGADLVYDLTISGVSEFIANGIVVHNCTNPNVQQIPSTSDFRMCFVASAGYKLVTCDYSQAELRILAELSGDPGFVDAFVSGGDLHAITASQMFQVELADVSKQQRSAAKSINFGLAYGRGPGSLALQLGVTPDAARELIDKYFKAYQGVQKWLDKAARDSVRLGYSETTLGRKRFYDVPTDRNDPEYRTRIASIERQGKNTPIQGGNADMTKIALVYLRDCLRGYDARIINTVHDEIVVEAIESQAEEVKQIVETQMVRAGAEILQRVPVVADAAVGDYWKK